MGEQPCEAKPFEYPSRSSWPEANESGRIFQAASKIFDFSPDGCQRCRTVFARRRQARSSGRAGDVEAPGLSRALVLLDLFLARGLVHVVPNHQRAILTDDRNEGGSNETSGACGCGNRAVVNERIFNAAPQSVQFCRSA